MTKNCFIWSRVSTKHQEENGGSLDDQKCRCESMPVKTATLSRVILAARTKVPRPQVN